MFHRSWVGPSAIRTSRRIGSTTARIAYEKPDSDSPHGVRARAAASSAGLDRALPQTWEYTRRARYHIPKDHACDRSKRVAPVYEDGFNIPGRLTPPASFEAGHLPGRWRDLSRVPDLSSYARSCRMKAAPCPGNSFLALRRSYQVLRPSTCAFASPPCRRGQTPRSPKGQGKEPSQEETVAS